MAWEGKNKIVSERERERIKWNYIWIRRKNIEKNVGREQTKKKTKWVR